MCGFARHILGCLIFLVVLGPILIIAGLVLLLSENTREEDVQKYNTAVDDFDTSKSSINLWTGSAYQATTASIANFSTTSRSVVISGNTDDVHAATSTLVTGTLYSYSTNAALQYDMDFESFSRDFPFVKASQTDIRCSSSACSTFCFSDHDRHCRDDSLLTTECQNTYTSDATFTRTDDNCEGTEVCGHCNHDSYATSLCAVADVDNEGVSKASTSKQSCRYPFGLNDHEYTATRPTHNSFTSVYSISEGVDIELRANVDPYIVLQEITEGSNDFGISHEEQRNFGITCLVLGMLTTMGFCGLLYYGLRNKNQQQDGVVAVQQPQQQEMYPQAQLVYPVAQQPTHHDQQQTSYPQAQPAYGQPQASGQPAPPSYREPQKQV